MEEHSKTLQTVSKINHTVESDGKANKKARFYLKKADNAQITSNEKRLTLHQNTCNISQRYSKFDMHQLT